MRHHAARLHRRRRETLVHHPLRDDDVGVRERRRRSPSRRRRRPALTPVPLGTSATARLFGKAGWMTVGFPVIASSRSTTAGSVS